MVSISLRFLAGRFHATPWGRHVNEGVPEWPPSPWRLLRAVVATAKRTMPEMNDLALGELLAPLAAPPLIHAPAAGPGHTRHYMPWFKKGPADRTLIFDTFAAVQPDAALYFVWRDVTLSSPQRALLATLLERMPYLGRAESWCEAALVKAGTEGGEARWTGSVGECRPLGAGEEPPPGTEAVGLLCAAVAPPADMLRALLVETAYMREREKQMIPAGSRWVRYARPSGAWVDFPLSPAVHREVRSLSVIRFALDGKPLPLWTDAIRVGELARAAVTSCLGGGGAERLTPDRSGHEVANAPAQHQHRHLFFLPEDLAGRGWVDHLLIYAPDGFMAEELERIAGRLKKLYRPGEAERHLLYLGGWTADELEKGPEPWKPSAVWESVTPYVLTRFPKLTRAGQPKLNGFGEQRDGAEDQIRREWRLRQAVDPSLPDLTGIAPLERHVLRDRSLSWSRFRRWREWGKGEATPFYGGYRLAFSRPFAGPVALGYACHFGLGQFRPAQDLGAMP